MTPEELKKKRNAARAFTHEDGRFRFDCLVPLPSAITRGVDGRRTTGEQDFLLVLDHVTGWDGVRGCDILPGESEEPVPFSRAMAELFFDDHLEELARLLTVLQLKTLERVRALEASRKN